MTKANNSCASLDFVTSGVFHMPELVVFLLVMEYIFCNQWAGEDVILKSLVSLK